MNNSEVVILVAFLIFFPKMNCAANIVRKKNQFTKCTGQCTIKSSGLLLT